MKVCPSGFYVSNDREQAYVVFTGYLLRNQINWYSFMQDQTNRNIQLVQNIDLVRAASEKNIPCESVLTHNSIHKN